MPRFVYDGAIFYDSQGNLLKSIVVSRAGLTFENAMFLDIFNRKDIDKIIYNLVLYTTLFNYIDLDEICNYVDDFPNFMSKFINLYQYIQDTYPNKLKNIRSQLAYMVFNKTLIPEVVLGEFKEFDYNKVEFSLVNNGIASFVKSFPLIPEFADKLMSQVKNFTELSNLENKIGTLSMCQIYFSLMATEYKDDSYLEFLDEINSLLEEHSEENPDYANFLQDNLIYEVKPEDTMCSNIDKFYDYLVNRLIQDKNVEAIKDFRDLLLESDTENPDFRKIVNNFLVFLEVYDFNDECKSFIKMRNNLTDRELVTTALLYFYTYYVTEECQKLIDKGNDKVRN